MKTINFVSNFYAIPENKFNKKYLTLALKILADNFGSNQQFVICQLLEAGLGVHPQYSKYKAVIDEAWKAELAKEEVNKQ